MSCQGAFQTPISEGLIYLTYHDLPWPTIVAVGFTKSFWEPWSILRIPWAHSSTKQQDVWSSCRCSMLRQVRVETAGWPVVFLSNFGTVLGFFIPKFPKMMIARGCIFRILITSIYWFGFLRIIILFIYIYSEDHHYIYIYTYVYIYIYLYIYICIYIWYIIAHMHFKQWEPASTDL